jgi:hypothetical protein
MRAAYHEGGHAVITCEYGLAAGGFRTRVLDEPDADGSVGSVKWDRVASHDDDDAPPTSLGEEYEPMARLHCARWAIVYFAGAAAEFRSRSWTDRHQTTSRTDRENAGHRFATFGFSPPNV